MCVAVLGLAACSGGGGASSVSPDDPNDDLPTVIEPEPDPTPTGAASYRGPLSFSFTPELSSQVNLSGTLSLAVNFGATTDAVTGEAAGFATATGDEVAGRLFLSSGVLNAENASLLMSSQISGSLQSDGTGYLVFGQLQGEVQGDAQTAVAGSMTGSVRVSGRDSPLDGQFAAGRVP